MTLRTGRELWEEVRAQLDDRGYALIPSLLQPQQCEDLACYYDDEQRFRSRIDMARYNFGQGEYKYFGYPLPDLVQKLRNSIYPELVPLANSWAERLGGKLRYPDRLSEFIERCHRAGQRRPTPLLLKYGAGDYNCLHQDLYGELVFPFQVTFFLSQRGQHFEGGEFVLSEQRPRQQSRVEVLTPDQVTPWCSPSHHRPVHGARGYYRANLRHGVSTVHSGKRYTLGIIFHDAK